MTETKGPCKKYVTRPGGRGVKQKDDKVWQGGRGVKQKSDVTPLKKNCFKFLQNTSVLSAIIIIIPLQCVVYVLNSKVIFRCIYRNISCFWYFCYHNFGHIKLISNSEFVTFWWVTWGEGVKNSDFRSDILFAWPLKWYSWAIKSYQVMVKKTRKKMRYSEDLPLLLHPFWNNHKDH